MSVNWQKVGLYAVGGAAGAVFGIFIAQFVMDVVATQKRMREIEEMEDGEEGAFKEDKEDLSPSEILGNGWKLRKKERINYSLADGKEPLDVMISKYKKTSDDAEIGVDLSEEDGRFKTVEETVTDVDRSKPYPITPEQYMAGFGDKKKKITKIYFYEDDEVCTDEFGKVLSKPEKFLGDDLINMFGGPSGDPGIAYIRNETLGLDYHVISINGSYEGPDMNQSPASRKANERGDD